MRRGPDGRRESPGGPLPVAGLDLGERRTKLVVLDVDGGSPRLVGWTEQPTPAGLFFGGRPVRPLDAAAWIRKLFAQVGASPRTLALAVPAGDVQIKRLLVPEPGNREATLRTLAASDGVEIIGDARTSRTLVVHASQDHLAQARSLIAQLDRRPPSVSIEWRQVEVNRSRMQQLGLSYQLGQVRDSLGRVEPGVTVRPAGGFRASGGRVLELLRRSPGGIGTLSLQGFVDAITEDGFGETETTQSITVNSDETAEIRVGDAFILPNNQPVLAGGGYVPAPFAQSPGAAAQPGTSAPGGTAAQPGVTVGGFQQFETGTSVRATAYVLSEDEVRLDLELVRDGGTLSPDGRSITGGRQTAFTRITVRNGTPIVIGGLTVRGRNRTNSGIPGLSKLPVIGRAFRDEGWAEQHRDLLIIVTPRINAQEDDH